MESLGALVFAGMVQPEIAIFRFSTNRAIEVLRQRAVGLMILAGDLNTRAFNGFSEWLMRLSQTFALSLTRLNVMFHDSHAY